MPFTLPSNPAVMFPTNQTRYYAVSTVSTPTTVDIATFLHRESHNVPRGFFRAQDIWPGDIICNYLEEPGFVVAVTRYKEEISGRVTVNVAQGFGIPDKQHEEESSSTFDVLDAIIISEYGVKPLKSYTSQEAEGDYFCVSIKNRKWLYMEYPT